MKNVRSALLAAAALSLLLTLSSQAFAYERAGEVVPPVLVHRVEPVYPHDLLRARFTGAVVIAGTVPKEGGRLREAHVETSDDARFEYAALAAVAEWRFSPGTQNGEPIDVAFRTTVRFSLENPNNPDHPVTETSGKESIRREVGNAPSNAETPMTSDRMHAVDWSVELLQDGRVLAASSEYGSIAEASLERRPFTIRIHMTKPADVRMNALATAATFERIRPGFDETRRCETPLYPCTETTLALDSHPTWLFTGEAATHALPADPDAEQWTRARQHEAGWTFERDVTEIDRHAIGSARLDELYLLLILERDRPLGAADIRKIHLSFVP